MGVIQWAGAVIMGLFVYVCANGLLDYVVTGTSTGEVIITNVFPIALACVALAVIIRWK